MTIKRITSKLLLLILVVGLQACGGGGGGSGGTPAAANPVGYYAGTLSTVSPSQTDISAKAIVDTDKFMLVHIDNAGGNSLLYVGTFTAITSTTFTADVAIYRNGLKLAQVATISNGLITEKSSMSGTLSGTGDYTGTSFSLTYDTVVNSRTPLVSAASDMWLEPFDITAGNRSGISFDNSTTLGTSLFGNASIVQDNLKGCGYISILLTNVVSEQPGRIRKYNVDYVGASCYPTARADFSMSHYMTSFDSGSNDNRYLWITYNANNFFAGELVKQ